jgi:hypothetical protein
MIHLRKFRLMRITIFTIILFSFSKFLSSQVQAERTNDFMESFGISGLKVERYTSDQMPHVMQRVADLKVRYARNRIHTNSTYVNRQYQIYTELGIKWILNYATMGLTPAQGVNRLKNHYPGLEMLLAVEGLNEPFNFSKGYEASDYFDHQAGIYELFKGDPELQHIPVVGLSVAHRNRYELIGDMSGVSDIGNLHSYPTVTLPPSGGILERWIEAADNASFPGMQLWCTEAGYHDNVHIGGTPENVYAKYLPRMILYYFLNERVDKLFVYRFMDQATDLDSKWWGITHNDATATPKLAYTAWKNMNTILDDSDSTFTPETLNYSLSGDLANINQVLLQKGDGTFYLVLWQEVRNWHVEGNEYTYPDRQLTLNLDSPAKNVQIYLPSFDSGTWPNEGHGTSPKDIYSGVSSIQIEVPDHILIIEISGVVEETTIPVTGVEIDPSSLELYSGDTSDLTAIISPQDATNIDVIWGSDNESVATVDSTGKVTAVSEGTATVTITTVDGGYTDSCFITVAGPVWSEKITESIRLYPNPVTGDYLTVNATHGSWINIFDVNGRKVYSNQMTGESHRVYVRSYIDGIYIVQILDGGRSETRSLMINK